MSSTTLDATNGKRCHDLYPELGTGPIPVEPYISREYFERERALIFRKVWLNAGRVDDIPNPGDYFVKDLAICDTSILVVRGKDGAIRAFHNMCSHRGNKLVPSASGKCKGLFVCNFHSWSYALDGSLRHITDEANFFNLDKTSLGLTPVSVGTWEGFIFINVDQNPAETLAEYLGEFGSTFSGYPFGGLAATRFFWQTEIKANWKIIKDAFQEVWHIPYLHQRTVFYSPGERYGSAMRFNLYPRHGKLYGTRAETQSNISKARRKLTQVESFAVRYGSGAIHLDRPSGASTKIPIPSGDQLAALGGCSIFPNCVMYTNERTYLTHTFWPLAEDRTLWEVKYYYPKAHTLAERFAQEYHKVILRDINLEDGSTLERTQTMLRSGAKQYLVLQDQELLIRHHHKVADTFLNPQDTAR
jgi:phenylpropionate dioxygenase-like ring-hydroxylating dioxygenase large terminal subunit